MARETDRPYFRHSILELEALFGRSRMEPHELRLLDHELKHRATDRAERLRANVSKALAVLSTQKQHHIPDRDDGENVAPNPPQIDLGALPSIATPTEVNEPRAILAAWTALEALAPQTYRRPEDLAAGDRSCVADLSTGRIPWNEKERSRPKKQLYYQVVLGAIPMDAATVDLMKVFGAQEEQSPRTREKAAIGALLVDRRGIVVEENGIAISSFAWALPLALQQRLGSLGAWATVEAKIIERLESMVRRVDRDGRPIPLDLQTIYCAYRWLAVQFGIPAHLAEPPTFALRVYHYFKASNPPDALLLNSFFLRDLARGAAMVDKQTVPAGLNAYLGIDKPAQTFDLLTDRTALEAAIAPAVIPAARWPSPGAHPLVTLQQAAVNLARTELARGEGVVAVNGPPGTGKTTLLRDLVASCVFDRALAMAAFEDPERAFTVSGERVKAGEKAFFHLYALAPTLKGHEVLVASSNNKAVENVSKELPAARAIGWTTNELQYFKSVSDSVFGSRQSADDDADDEPAREATDTWGMIAAVLGNAQNRAAFQRSFWWDVDRGFRLYLKAAKGDSIVQEIVEPKTGAIERRTPAIVLAERPPSPQQAKINWRKAKEHLLTLAHTIQDELAALEHVRQSCLQVSKTTPQVQEVEAFLSTSAFERASLDERRSQHVNSVTAARSQHAACARRVQEHRQSRPGLFARLLRTERARMWSKAHVPLVEVETAARNVLRSAERALSDASAALDLAAESIRKAEVRLTGLRQQVAQLSEQIERHRRALGGRLVDDQFLAEGHDVSNLAAPWVPDSLHAKREELFAAGLAVHRAFIDAAAQKVLHNLSVLMGVFASGPPGDEARRRLLGDLWSTLFLVVPVVSTTFASVDRMLGDLAASSIGWLLVDEAGQALPQAAVGAVMRARRSIIVGDPLQIPPVVTLPDRLTSEVCKFFKVETSRWAAPEASAQTVADHASRFQASFNSDRGPRVAGIPLLVHRRCDEPMFGMSNRIAYDGQMVHAVAQRAASAIADVLGPSAWLDVDGEADSKWCPAEGELVTALLTRIADAGISHPDLFIITPFRIVASEFRRRLAAEDRLFARLGVNGRNWSTNRVGTIHTVQGREADAVILMLGAPKASHHGARSWAAGTPNILNVAVSRAKQRLYVVGSYGAWSGVGYATVLASAMNRVRV